MQFLQDGNKSESFGYGGDFEDKEYLHTNDAQFCINGIFSPDRKPHPAASEIKYLHQPIQLVGDFVSGMKQRHISSRGEYLGFTFINRFHTLSWSDVYVEYFYSTDDCSGPSGNMDCSAYERNSSKNVETFSYVPMDCSGVEALPVYTLDRARSHLAGDQRCWITFRWYFRSKRSWQGNGRSPKDPISVEKIELCPSRVNFDEIGGIERLLREESSSIRFQEASGSIEIWVRSNNERYMRKYAVVDKATGCLVSYCDRNGTELLLEPLIPNFTRACTDNDRGGVDRMRGLMPRWVAIMFRLVKRALLNYSYWYRWQKLGLDPESPPEPQCETIKLFQDLEDSVIIDTSISMKSPGKETLCKIRVVYRFRCDGCVKITVTMEPRSGNPAIPTFPRIGFSFCMNKKLTDIIFLGRGKVENYPDRKTGSEMGLWSNLPESRSDYIVPSEHGNRCDCSWLCCRDNNSTGFLFTAAHDGVGPAHFDFSALLHNQKELHRATHAYQLEDRKTGTHPIYVNLDMFNFGIGGDIGWGPCVYNEYLLKPDRKYEAR